MLSSSLPWLRAHWRPLAAALALMLAFVLGRFVRPAPRIEYREQVVYREREAAHIEQAQQATAQQDTAAVASASLTAHHRVHRHRVITTAPDGSSTDTRDTIVDDGLTLETAQEVVIHLETASLVLGALDLSREVEARREVEVMQTPAAPQHWRVGGLAGFGASGPVYGGQAAWSPGKVPILGAKVWIGAWGLTAPAGGLSLGASW